MDADATRELMRLPNVGPSIAADLLRVGIRRQADLVGRDGDVLYDRLCRIDGVRHDPCLRDVFAAVVDFAGGAPERPWWHYTPARKARDAARARKS
jgi:hypothetical protein